ncbi:MAG: ligase [Rhodoferax sp.]|nr:ligase [Rhodoferax sp.]
MLGCSQRSLQDDIEHRLHGRAEVMARESGGGAVLTGPWLVSASVVLPPGHPWVCDGLIDSYRRLGQSHVAVLNAFGVPARALPPQELPRTHDANGVSAVDWACFGGLSPWELVDAEGRKLVGLAQRRCKAGVLLVAGTLVGAVDWTLLCDAMGYPQHEPLMRHGTVCAQELAGCEIEPQRFAAALMQCLERELSTTLA